MNNKKYKQDNTPIYPIRENLDSLSLAAFQLTMIILHSGKIYSEHETKDHIKRFRAQFASAPDPYKDYIKYCQIIILIPAIIKEYCPDYVYDTITQIDELMLTLAAEQLNEIELRRIMKPLYKNKLKALPEAILELVENYTLENKHYWQKWFTVKEAKAEGRIFRKFCKTLKSLHHD